MSRENRVPRRRHAAADHRDRFRPDGSRPVALVTGASSGIGAATALRLAREGYAVALVARRLERLNEVARAAGAAERVLVIAADLTLEDERRRVLEAVRERFGPIDVLVNNAGSGWYGYGFRMPWTTARQMLGLNVQAAVHFTLELLPEMLDRGSGHVLNVSSIAGSFYPPGVALYAASKSFLDTFTVALSRELRDSPVAVSLVKPGPVRTEFYDTARTREAGLPVPGAGRGVTAERVAELIVGLLEHPRQRAFVPSRYALMAWVEPLFGRLLDRLGPILLRRTPGALRPEQPAGARTDSRAAP